MAACLVKRMDLLRREVASYLPHVSDDLFDEGFTLTWLMDNKMTPTLVGNLDKRIAGHILNT